MNGTGPSTVSSTRTEQHQHSDSERACYTGFAGLQNQEQLFVKIEATPITIASVGDAATELGSIVCCSLRIKV
eukprot:m.13145 g.13145  ORF g.13145 m.13145 type:complete len:73 (+) comp8027_c0_seq1:372-590(+)